jgi:hypothetical protein
MFMNKSTKARRAIWRDKFWHFAPVRLTAFTTIFAESGAP